MKELNKAFIYFIYEQIRRLGGDWWRKAIL